MKLNFAEEEKLEYLEKKASKRGGLSDVFQPVLTTSYIFYHLCLGACTYLVEHFKVVFRNGI